MNSAIGKGAMAAFRESPGNFSWSRQIHVNCVRAAPGDVESHLHLSLYRESRVKIDELRAIQERDD
jgi:hypothetical protein